jgi:hypothetical protein
MCRSILLAVYQILDAQAGSRIAQRNQHLLAARPTPGNIALTGLGQMIDVDAKVFDRSDEIVANCSRKRSNNLHDQCDKPCLDLPNILWIIIAFSRFALEQCRRHLQQKTGVHDTVAPITKQ